MEQVFAHLEQNAYFSDNYPDLDEAERFVAEQGWQPEDA